MIRELNRETTRASQDAALSMALEIRCQRPQTPPLNLRPTLVSPREVEVALNAAARSTSRQIADTHSISIRTVDNHLSSVYRKLGLGGREELAAIFSLVLATE